jgi:hypothetical protein
LVNLVVVPNDLGEVVNVGIRHIHTTMVRRVNKTGNPIVPQPLS